jgi:hypothetical protein
MVDWLMVWGVTQAAGLVFKPILEDLAKESVNEVGFVGYDGGVL